MNIVNAQYLPSAKAYEATNFKLGTVHSTKTCITDKRRDLQGQGRKVTFSAWQVLAHKSRTKRL